MPRTEAELPSGMRVTDHVSLGVIANTFPLRKVKKVLRQTGRESQRERALPAHVIVYYVIALALYMEVSCREVLGCLLEGIRWLRLAGTPIHLAGRAAISRARVRVGWEPLKQLHDEIVGPIAVRETKGAWYRQWRLVSIDGSTMAVADTTNNEEAFGRPGASRGVSAYPQFRFVSLVENGTHVLFSTQLGKYADSEVSLAEAVVGCLKLGMLCLADRGYYGFALWKTARATQADLLWRVKANLRLPCAERLSDGSYLSKVYPSERDRRHDANGLVVRVIEYVIEGVPDAEPVYRLITTILDCERAPAQELAVLYHERWEIEGAFDELKTHLRGQHIVLRSKTKDLVVQEFYGLLMAHFAIRGLMHEAALKAGADPDTVSFVHTVRVVRRVLPLFAAFSPGEEEPTAPCRTG